MREVEGRHKAKRGSVGSNGDVEWGAWRSFGESKASLLRGWCLGRLSRIGLTDDPSSALLGGEWTMEDGGPRIEL